MKNTKKFLSLLLAMVMLMGCLSVSAAYPTTLLTPPNVTGSANNSQADNAIGNYGNDNSAWAFEYRDENTMAANPSYVLLDTNENGEYLIATNHEFKVKSDSGAAINHRPAFSTDSTNWMYDPTNTKSVADWVNRYKSDAGSVRMFYYLGKDLWDHLVEKQWKIEAVPNQNIPERTITAKAVIPSYTEYMTYREKLDAGKVAIAGYDPWLRTPSNYSGSSTGHVLTINLYSDTSVGYKRQGYLRYRANSSDGSMQVLFWVDADFFKEVKVSNIGSEVAKQLKADLTLDELTSLYDSTELSTYFGVNVGSANAPAISNMKIKTNINAIGGTATFSYVSTPASSQNKLGWYIADDAQGTNRTKLDILTGATVTIPKEAAGKYLMAGVTPISGYEIGNIVYSDAVKIENALETFSTTIKPVADWGMSTSHNPDYMFSTSWTNFVMLEAAEDGSDFLVIAQGNPWTSKIALSGSGVISMDPAENEYLPAFLNNEFLNIASDSNRVTYSDKAFITDKDGAVGLPSNVSPYVNRKALWRTEASKLTEEYVFEAAVTLPSMTELKKHSDKIGTDVLASWKTRTPVAGKDLDSGYLPMYVVVMTNKEKGTPPQISAWHAGSNTYTLVTFRLNREFFMNNKIGLTDKSVNSGKAVMGDKVKEMLVANFARSELRQAGYSEEELDLIGFPNNEPEVKNLTAMGIASAAQTITADFEYYDPNESEMKSAEYQWYYAETADGELFPIEGATNAKYKVANDMVGKYITVSVKVYNTENIKSATVKAPLIGPMGEREDIIVTPDEITTSGASFIIDNALSTQDMVILYCVYSKDKNILEYVKVEPIEVTYGEDTYSVNVTDFTVTANHKVKAMLWDSVETLRPYAVIEKR